MPSNLADCNDPMWELMQQGATITNESLDVAKNMNQLAEEAQEIGAKTMERLEHQGEQLNKVDRDMDGIKYNMQRTQRTLKKMNRCWLCGLASVFSRNKTTPASSKEQLYVYAVNAKRDEQKEKNKHSVTKQIRIQYDRMKNKDGKMKEPIQPTIITADAREEELNDCIKRFDNTLTGLHNMATDMSTELKTQNKKIERLKVTADTFDCNFAKSDKKVQGIIVSVYETEHEAGRRRKAESQQQDSEAGDAKRNRRQPNSNCTPKWIKTLTFTLIEAEEPEQTTTATTDRT